MAKQLPSLGELEIHVLRSIWQEQPCTERQVWELVRQDRSVGRTTVLKTMQRLEAKGLLDAGSRRGAGAISRVPSTSGGCCPPSCGVSSIAPWPGRSSRWWRTWPIRRSCRPRTWPRCARSRKMAAEEEKSKAG